MSHYIHARLSDEDMQSFEELKLLTNESTSNVIRLSLKELQKKIKNKKVKKYKNLLEAAGDIVGKYTSGIKDLSTNKKHMEGYGE